MKSSGFGKAMWSAIISRSLTKNMIYDHSRSWSPKSQKYDLKSIMIVIWSEMIGDHDDLDLALVWLVYWMIHKWNKFTHLDKKIACEIRVGDIGSWSPIISDQITIMSDCRYFFSWFWQSWSWVIVDHIFGEWS